MISKLISIFKKVEEDNNTYAKEFIDFYKQCVETFPKTLKSELKRKNINPCPKTGKENSSDNYYLGFTLADILWWEEQIENEPLYFKQPDVLKREIIKAALDVFDGLQIPDEKYKEYTKELIAGMADLNRNKEGE